MTFFFKFMEGPRQPWEGPEFAEQLGALLDHASHPRYKRVHSPDQADAILLVESNLFKERHYLNVIEREPMLQKWPEKCFTLNYDDDALGLLPGVYVGLPRHRFDPLRHRASCYVHPPNPRTAAKALIREVVEPLNLASFRGAISHPFRRRLLETEALKQMGPMTHIDRWFNHSEEEKENYLDEILASKFVLCPRGCSPSSIRLFEVMELGRVPVILADDWVPPEGPSWSRFSLRVSESRVSDLPAVIRSREGEWEEMARCARESWEKWFGPQSRIVSALMGVEELLLARPSNHQEGRCLQHWKSWAGRRKLGWTFPQRAISRLTKWSRANKQPVKATSPDSNPTASMPIPQEKSCDGSQKVMSTNP